MEVEGGELVMCVYVSVNYNKSIHLLKRLKSGLDYYGGRFFRFHSP